MSKTNSQYPNPDVFNHINESDLTEDLQILAGIVGIETVRLLLNSFPRMGFYIPMIGRLDNFIQRYIRQNKDKPVKVLAQDLQVSETHLRKLRRSIQNHK